LISKFASLKISLSFNSKIIFAAIFFQIPGIEVIVTSSSIFTAWISLSIPRLSILFATFHPIPETFISSLKSSFSSFSRKPKRL
jgi:hypothetical protein